MISKTYCPLPFNHLYITPTSKADICCAFDLGQEDKFLASDTKNAAFYRQSDIKKYKNLGDHLTHPFVKDIQQKMLKGEKVEGCSKCYYFEENGLESVRKGFIERYHTEFSDFTPPDLDNPKLEFLEVTFGNYCNLACRTCSSDLSHSWIEDEKKLRQYDIIPSSMNLETRTNVERQWHKDDFKDLRHIKITGGEPMLHPDFYEFIEKLNQPQMSLEIFTNVSWVPKRKLINILSKFKSCEIFISMDGIGTVQEYIRHNSKWDITEKSVRKWLETMKMQNNIRVTWAPVWSLMNGNYFIETCTWWLKTINEILNDDADKCGVASNFLFYPEHYRMNLLSNQNELKQKAEEYITELKNIPFLKNRRLLKIIEMSEEYIKFFEGQTKNEITSKNAYYKTTQALDEIRNQSLKEMMPLTYEAMWNGPQVGQ